MRHDDSKTIPISVLGKAMRFPLMADAVEKGLENIAEQ
jgi:hypothetical protein